MQHLPDAVSICTPEARITSNPSSRPAFCSRAAIANHIHSAKASFLASYSPPYPFAASTSLLGQLCTNHIARYQLCIRQATPDPPYVPSHHRSPKTKARPLRPEAYKPASYTLSSLSTVTQAIFAAGGVSDIGSLRNIQVKRQGNVVAELDLYDLLLKGDTSGDVSLMAGDVVFIPTRGKTVAVKGSVTRPAIYEVKQESSVREVIKLAGGLLPTAF